MKRLAAGAIVLASLGLLVFALFGRAQGPPTYPHTFGGMTGPVPLSYLDDNFGAVTLNSLLPSQASKAGDYLTTNGTNASWIPITLPSYTTAGLPAAGFAGRQAYVSDTQRVVIDNGTAWQDPNAARLLIVTSAGNTCAANTVLCINANNNPTQSHPQTVQINNCNTGETFGLCLSPPANGQDGLAIFRWTDVAPSGNLVYVANLANTFTILSLDVNGNLATCLPANCGAGTGNVYVGGTLFAPNGAPAGTGASISSAQTVNGNDTLLLTRKTDTSPTGNYIRALNAAQNAVMFTLNMDGSITLNGVTFNNLGTPADGTIQRCIDCDPPTVVDNTCTHAGAQTGAMALRINGAWKCVG